MNLREKIVKAHDIIVSKYNGSGASEHKLTNATELLRQVLDELDKPKEPTDVSEFVKGSSFSLGELRATWIVNYIKYGIDAIKITEEMTTREMDWKIREQYHAQLKAKDNEIKALQSNRNKVE